MIGRQIIIPGAPKSGTTNLFFTICKHNDVDKPEEKEPHLFSLKNKCVNNNLKWYLSLYSGNGIKIDASTSYLYSNRFVKNVKDTVGKPYILILLRDPAKRAFSQYKHMTKQVPKAEDRKFSKIVEDIEGESPKKIIEKEDNYTERSIERGDITGNYYGEDYLSRYCGAPFKSKFEDPNWQYKYIQNSIYHVRTERLIKEFGSNVMIVFFEEYIQEPSVQLERILSFTNLIDNSHNLKPSNKKYKTRVPSGPISRAIKYVRNDTAVGEKIDSLTKYLRILGLDVFVDYFRDEVMYHNPSLLRRDYHRMRKLLSFEYEYWFEKNPSLKNKWTY